MCSTHFSALKMCIYPGLPVSAFLEYVTALEKRQPGNPGTRID